jgi:hypothetical protein
MGEIYGEDLRRHAIYVKFHEDWYKLVKAVKADKQAARQKGDLISLLLLF